MNLECLVPLFTTTLSAKIPTKMGNYVKGMHNLTGKVLSSIYNPQNHIGVMMETTECAINYISTFFNGNPPSPCDNTHKITGAVDNNGGKILLLKPEGIGNGTTNIFGDTYTVSNSSGSYNTLSLNNIVKFLGLEDCSAESVTHLTQNL